MEKCAVVIVRMASGDVEYHYEAALPKVGDRHGREGESGFVTRVELNGPDEATVIVGTSAPEFVGWDDLGAATDDAPRRSRSRERILDAAYDLFSRTASARSGLDAIIAASGVRADRRSTATSRRRTRSTLDFLERREERWTRDWLQRKPSAAPTTPPRARLLAIFDVFDEWFQLPRLRGLLLHQRPARDHRPREPGTAGERPAPGNDPHLRRRARGRGGCP